MGRYLTPLAKIRRAVCERAEGSCECCGVHVGFAGELGQLDHAFGRKHVAEAVSNCWILCPQCHDDKTQSRPTAIWWLVRLTEHLGRHGYDEEVERAEIRLQVLAQKFPQQEPAP
jgi:hypothetical protein